jgi:competence protein ComFC
MEEHRRGEICLDCRKWEQDPDSTGLLRMNRSVYQYNEQMQEVLARYKFRGDAVICSAFEAEFREVYDLFYKKGNLLLVPIPLSGERLYERGFNQSLLLAELLKERVVQPLSKTETEKQSKKTRRDRLQRENSFHVSEPELVRGKDVLLIDDIYTTGTTLRMAAIRLRQAGAGEISALTLVRS